MNNIQKGNIGERIAANYLEERGIIIIERNFRHGKSEIDIIARDGEDTVFIEVKSRGGLNYGRGAEAVTLKKQEMIIKGAYAYCDKYALFESSIRFDVVEVDLKTRRVINHIKGAFLTM